ncbi:hypothetical protein BC937DRAFT_88105, partial [Endogone sp. FLAS-F59071]
PSVSIYLAKRDPLSPRPPSIWQNALWSLTKRAPISIYLQNALHIYLAERALVSIKMLQSPSTCSSLLFTWKNVLQFSIYLAKPEKMHSSLWCSGLHLPSKTCSNFIKSY